MAEPITTEPATPEPSTPSTPSEPSTPTAPSTPDTPSTPSSGSGSTGTTPDCSSFSDVTNNDATPPEPQNNAFSVMAKWGDKEWGVSKDRICAIDDGSIKTSMSLKEDTNEDKSGKPATAPLTMELEELSFTYTCNTLRGKVKGGDEYESWRKLFGQHHPFYLAGKRFGPKEYMPKSVELEEEHHIDSGKFWQVKIAVTFKEYAPSKSKDKKTKKSKSGSKSQKGKKSNNKSKKSASKVGR